MNRVIITGNLTRDSELRRTTSGTAICNFTVAVTTKYKSGNELKEDTFFADIVVWGAMGENCNKYLSKGSKCLVEGRLTKRSWEKDGQKHGKTEIIASAVEFLSPKKELGQSSKADTSQDETEMEPF